MKSSPDKTTAANAGWRTQFRFRGSRHLPGVAEFYRWRLGTLSPTANIQQKTTLKGIHALRNHSSCRDHSLPRRRIRRASWKAVAN